MQFFSLLPALLAIAPAAMGQTTTSLVPDPPATYLASFFNASSTCSQTIAHGTVKAGVCSNYTVPVGGSIILEVGKALYGYASDDCSGDAITTLNTTFACTEVETVLGSFLGVAA